jgi:hypothetical protein
MRRLNIFDGQVKVGVASRSPCWSTPSRSHRTPQTPQPDDNALNSSSASARPALGQRFLLRQRRLWHRVFTDLRSGNASIG